MKTTVKGAEILLPKVTDFHAHLLPALDDGSPDGATSAAMLTAMAKNSEIVVATPHFYAWQDAPARFLARREEAVERLRASLPEVRPTVCLGAEVGYFAGIGRSEDMVKFCIDGTRVLLVELPFDAWSEDVVGDVFALRENFGILPVIAHTERYLDYRGNAAWADVFRDAGIPLQSNASFFLDKKMKKTALRRMRDGKIALLGTDAHNMEKRAPNLGEAIAQVAAEDGGTDFCRDADAYARELLADALPIVEGAGV